MIVVRFLSRDLSDFRIYWIIFGILTVIYAITSYASHSQSHFEWLFLAYFLFAIFPINYIFGSVWRTQHQMSRYYLLALPINRRKLFALQHLRLIMFWVPVLGLSAVYPFLSGISSAFFLKTWVLYYLGLLTTAGLYLEHAVWSTVEGEYIKSYIPKGARFGYYVKMIGIPFAALFFLIMPAWENLLIPIWFPEFQRAIRAPSIMGIESPSPYVVFPIGAIVLLFWIPRITRKWCVSP